MYLLFCIHCFEIAEQLRESLLVLLTQLTHLAVVSMEQPGNSC